MSIFNIFKKKENKPLEPIIDDKQTSIKYISEKEEIINWFLLNLRKLNSIEEEMFVKARSLREKNRKNGTPSSQVGPGEKDLDEKFSKDYGELAKKICTEKLLKRGYANAYGNPAKYAHLNEGCSLEFIMKSENKATIITEVKDERSLKYKFSLRKENNVWKIDEVHYGFKNDDSWYVRSI